VTGDAGARWFAGQRDVGSSLVDRSCSWPVADDLQLLVTITLALVNAKCLGRRTLDERFLSIFLAY
jgi:hypothetical protein